MEVELVGTEERKRRKSEQIEKKRSVWSEEGVEHYHKKCEGWYIRREQKNLEGVQRKSKEFSDESREKDN